MKGIGHVRTSKESVLRQASQGKQLEVRQGGLRQVGGGTRGYAHFRARVGPSKPAAPVFIEYNEVIL